MKRSEMNERQKKAFDNIKYAAYNLLGGLENTMMDYSEDEEEYQDAKALLENHDRLVNEIYDMATTNYYREGFEGFGEQWKSLVKEIKFCGKDWLIERVEARVTKEGY